MIFPSEVTTPKYEATALKHALLLAISNGFERVIFKSQHQLGMANKPKPVGSARTRTRVNG
jgi:hypothetical protein